jgi:hypothetical protein
VRGRANNGSAQGTYGVYGDSVAPAGIGVYGEALSFSGATFGGSFKTNSPEGTSVYGPTTADSADAIAIYSDAPGSSAYAGYFAGKVQITGMLSKAGGSFTIDHPLDPERKYLSHSFVESPEMLNVYNGNITTDASGQATEGCRSQFAPHLRSVLHVVRCMSSVVTQLRCEPLVQRCDERRVAGGVADLRTLRQLAVGKVDAASTLAQRRKPWHLLAVDGRRVGEVATRKLGGLVFEVLSDQRDLFGVSRVLGNHLLQPAVRLRLKHMRRRVEVEGHHAGPARGDLLLAGWYAE